MRLETTIAWFGPRGVALAAMLLGPSCTAELTASDPQRPDFADAAPTPARRAFDATVMPKLEARCQFCHGDPAMAPAFLVGSPDPYATIKAWPSLLVLDEPEQSRLLTKGDHDGPAWTDAEASDVLAWLRLEQQEALGLPAELLTAVTPVAPGANAIDLGILGLPGTTVTFLAAFTEQGLELDMLEVRAGPEGAHVVDPSFVPYVDGGRADDLRHDLDGVDVEVAPHEASALGDGALSLAGIAAEAALAVRFALAEPAPAAAPHAPSGEPCADLPAFSSAAIPPLAQHCASCHDGADGPATAALDLSGLADPGDAAQAAVCGRVRASVDLDEPMHSALFTEVNPLLAEAHPFRFGGDYEIFRTFRTAVLQWVLGREVGP
jgi:hypothetical protein